MKKNKEKQRDLTELKQAFVEIQMPRTPYALEHLVVNARFTTEMKYYQCVLELSSAYDNLRIAELRLEQKQIEVDEIDTKKRTDEIEKEIKKIEMEQTKLAVIGAMREFEYLYKLWEQFPKKYTREELDRAQEEEYRLKLETQAKHDLNATGRISAGNQEGLRQIGQMPYPEIDLVKNVEEKYLAEGKSRILIGVATELKAVNGCPSIEGLEMPVGSEYKLHNCYGMAVDDAYNNIVKIALEEKADFIVTVEDDTFPPKDAITRLMNLLRANPKTAVGAWYPIREESKQGAAIILKNGKRQQLDADGEVHEVYTLPMGCSIFPIEMFMQIPFPWFKTTVHLSQDNFFSQLARENGWKLLVDTSVRCKHIDRITKKVYE